jgi:hypothetical protein
MTEKDIHLPPMRSRPSTTATVKPCSCSLEAATRPEMPAPTTTTSTSEGAAAAAAAVEEEAIAAQPKSTAAVVAPPTFETWWRRALRRLVFDERGRAV